MAEGVPCWPDFAAAVHTAAVIDAVLASCDRHAWVSVAEIEKEAWS